MVDATVSTPLWERQGGEGNRAYEAFALYRDMGVNRSTRDVAKQLGKSLTVIARWSGSNNWVERVASWDNYQDDLHRKSLEKRVGAIIASDTETLLAVNREIIKRLEGDPLSYTSLQLIKMSKQLSQRLGTQRRNARARNSWLRLRFTVLERDSFRCQYCGKSPALDDITLHVDHITPRSHGGTNDMDNLVTSCHICNLGKGDVLLQQREIEKG